MDDRDVPALALMADACHAHGALAGIELCFNGYATENRYSREIPVAPSHRRRAAWTRSRLGAWTGATSPTLAAGTAPPRCARDAGFDLVLCLRRA